jgi:hypothetical protein
MKAKCYFPTAIYKMYFCLKKKYFIEYVIIRFWCLYVSFKAKEIADVIFWSFSVVRKHNPEL